MEPNLQGIDGPKVTAWLEANVPGARGPFSFELIAGGHSNLTYRVTGTDGRPMVLRRPPLGNVLPSAHDMGREHTIISALQPTPVPVAPALGYTDDPEVNGAPFYVMGFVDGLVLRDLAAVEAALPEEHRPATARSVVDTLAAIHDVDPVAVGLGGLGRHEGYIARQLKRWHGQWTASKTRERPAVDEVHQALAAHIPEQQKVAIVHGDYRLDNCMVSPAGEVVAVLDWEICTLGDPLADLGLLLVYWTGPDDEPSAWVGPATTAPGFPNRDTLVARYAEVSGRDLSQLEFYTAFGFWKLACILEGVYARYLAGAMGTGRDPGELDVFRWQVERAAAQAAEHAGRLT
jgi:aminoglycoside phosphotransferase (APT) family kinase protein